MLVNLTGFELRFGSPNAVPIPPDGSAVVRRADRPPAPPLELPDGQILPAMSDAPVVGVDGLGEHDGPDAVLIVSAQVASAMEALGIRRGKAVYSPGLLKEQDGVKYATAPVHHAAASGR